MIRLLFGAGLAALLLAGAGAEAADKTVTLKLSYWVPPTHLLTPGYKEWAAEVDKATNGSVKTTLYPSSQLGSGRDHYDMVKRGIADFGLINPGYTPGRFPVIAASDLPFLISDSQNAATALTRWYRKYAEKEMSDHYVCHVFTHDLATIHTAKKPIRVPDDVRGLNIRTANQTMSRYVTAMGGNPVQVPIMEAKDTLSKGITDGITVTFGGLLGTFKFHEVTKYTLDSPLYVSTFTHGISKSTYNRLSKDQRKAIDDHCTPQSAAKIYRFWYEDDHKQAAMARELKDQVYTKIGPAEVALWRKAAEPVMAQWREAVTKAGLNADTVMRELKDELKKENALF